MKAWVFQAPQLRLLSNCFFLLKRIWFQTILKLKRCSHICKLKMYNLLDQQDQLDLIVYSEQVLLNKQNYQLLSSYELLSLTKIAWIANCYSKWETAKSLVDYQTFFQRWSIHNSAMNLLKRIEIWALSIMMDR